MFHQVTIKIVLASEGQAKPSSAQIVHVLPAGYFQNFPAFQGGAEVPADKTLHTAVGDVPAEGVRLFLEGQFSSVLLDIRAPGFDLHQVDVQEQPGEAQSKVSFSHAP